MDDCLTSAGKIVTGCIIDGVGDCQSDPPSYAGPDFDEPRCDSGKAMVKKQVCDVTECPAGFCWWEVCSLP